MPESQPNYLTVESDGSVGADFSGHISAAGLDLLAGEVASPADDRKIRWLRESNGALIADIYSSRAGGDSSVNVRSHSEAGNGAFAYLESDDGAARSYVEVLADTPIQRVTVSAGHTVDLITQDHKSSFVFSEGGTDTQIIWAGGPNLDFFVDGVLVKSI